MIDQMMSTLNLSRHSMVGPTSIHHGVGVLPSCKQGRRTSFSRFELGFMSHGQPTRFLDLSKINAEMQDNKTPPTPFTLHVSDAQLVDLHRRLHTTRWPDQVRSRTFGDVVGGNEDWRYGTELNALQQLVSYWTDEFDWRKQEVAFNALPQFKMPVRGLMLHFVHQRSTKLNAPALLLCQ
jgi:hypothetical protein